MNDKPVFQPSSRYACVGMSMTGAPNHAWNRSADVDLQSGKTA